MKILLVTLLALGFTSCMHWGMMGVSHRHHAGQMHIMTTRAVLEREVTAGDVKAIGIFPSLEYDKDVILTLKLMDAKTSSPISKGKVHFEAQYAGSAGQDQRNEPPYAPVQSVVESRVSGVYTIPYRTAQPGEHRLIFHITGIDGREIEPEMVVETISVLSSEREEHHGNMVDGMSITPLVIAGAAVMGAMMVSMLVGRRIF